MNWPITDRISLDGRDPGLREETRSLNPDQFRSKMRLREAYSRCGKDVLFLRAVVEKKRLRAACYGAKRSESNDFITPVARIFLLSACCL